MPVVIPAQSPVSSATTDALSFDGRIRAIDNPEFGGVRIKIDYSADLALWSNPFRCTVYRKHEDGSVYTVRGGDPYLNYAGEGWLYDQEAPLGQQVSYYVVPVDAQGTIGVQSGAASIVTSVPAGGFDHPDMWLVNLENPGASVQARGTSTLSGSYNGRSDKQVVLGSPYPTVTPDTRNGLTTQITVLTIGEQEFRAMQELLKQSVIMRKSSLWERPDGYFTVDDVSYTAQASGTGKGIYAWQLGLTEVSRPNTYGQTVTSPDFTFTADKAQYPLFSNLPVLPFDAVQGGNMMDLFTAEGDGTSSPTTGWDPYNANTTITRVTEQVYRGPYSRKIVAAAAGNIGAIASATYPVIQGRTYTFTMWMYSPYGLVADLTLDWRTGTGTVLSTDSLSEFGQAVALTPYTWTRVVLKATPVSGAEFLKPWLKLTATSAGQYGYFDAGSMENI